MSDMMLRGTGRGGAGNFVSRKDMEEAERAQRANDPESQQPSTPTMASNPPRYVRGGRGGAGNFSEPTPGAVVRDRQLEGGNDDGDVVVVLGSPVAGRPRGAGLTGRGGAGNWTDEGARRDGGRTAAQEEERARKRRIADSISDAVDASLPPPPKTYRQHDRDME